MKVLFLFGTLTHYIVKVLNRLNDIENYQIVAIIPPKQSISVGKGVYQNQTGAEFKVIYSEEYTTYYNKPFFFNFIRIIKQEKPNLIVAGWPYILGLVFIPRIFFYLKNQKIKIVHRDIPFQLPKFNETIDFYKNKGFFSESEGYTKKKFKIIDFFKYKFLAYIRRIYFNLADANIYYTEDAFNIIPSYGVPQEKIFITYNSPDTDELLEIFNRIKDKPPILPYNNHRLIHIGRLVKWKKVDLLIDAFKLIKEKYEAAELLIIGQGPEENYLKKSVADLGIKDSVKFLGAIYKPETLGEYLHSSSVYVLAGMGGLSINEAMCFGKPVICSVCDGTEKKLVREGYNGFYFKLDNKDDLIKKIDLLFSNPDLIEEMGKNSIKIIKEEVNINTVIQGLYDAFEYAVSSKN